VTQWLRNGGAPMSLAHIEEEGEAAGSGEDGGAAVRHPYQRGRRWRADKAGPSFGPGRSETGRFIPAMIVEPPRPTNESAMRGDTAADRWAPLVSRNPN
jgi:hypothetical protein